MDENHPGGIPQIKYQVKIIQNTYDPINIPTLVSNETFISHKKNKKKKNIQSTCHSMWIYVMKIISFVNTHAHSILLHTNLIYIVSM